MEEIRMWIARDEGIYEDEMDDEPQVGKLHLFYDTPLWHRDSETNTFKFDCARCIGEIPSYMYPWIEEGCCYEISGNKTTYKKELQKISKEVVCVLKTKLLRGYEYKDWNGFYNGNGEDMSSDIENLVKMAENNLR